MVTWTVWYTRIISGRGSLHCHQPWWHTPLHKGIMKRRGFWRGSSQIVTFVQHTNFSYRISADILSSLQVGTCRAWAAKRDARQMCWNQVGAISPLQIKPDPLVEPCLKRKTWCFCTLPMIPMDEHSNGKFWSKYVSILIAQASALSILRLQNPSENSTKVFFLNTI